MMVLIRLFYEFFKTGLFSVGGGMATIPFLQHMGETTGWFTNGDLTTMIAVSESTPGPMGVNMATYVGFEIAGIPEMCIRDRVWPSHTPSRSSSKRTGSVSPTKESR